MLRLYTFGGLRIERDGQSVRLPTRRAHDLLAYLLTFRDRRHPRVILAAVLWPDLAEDKARRRLSDTLWRVRRVLGDHVAADEESLWFNPAPPYWLDVERFEELANREAGGLADWSQGQAASLPTHQHTTLPTLREAIDLYHGPFLDGLYHDWVLLERERLHGLYLEMLGCLLERRKQAGDYTTALDIARRLIAAEPFHEAAHRELMRLYHLLGRDAEAISQYHRCRETLREELNVAPAPETEALYQILVRQAPFLRQVGPVHLPAPARRPAFDLERPPLVGRDSERAALLGHLEAAAAGQGGIVLLEGEAGIGKSRLAEEVIAGARWRGISTTLVRSGEVEALSYGLIVAAITPLLTPLRLRQLARSVEPTHLQAVATLMPVVTWALSELSPLPDLSPPRAHERLRNGLVALILALSRIVPHLWVLEDLQWADAESLSFLPLLLPHLTQSCLLLLITGRTAELRATPAVWNALQAMDRACSFPRYELGRLDANDITALVHCLLWGEGSTLSKRLARESEGVPLYLVETLKAWRDDGYLLPTDGGAWRWAEVAGAPVVLPSHLGEAVIGHRLSNLSPLAAKLLAAAAVAGTEVDFDLLACVCALSTSDHDLETPDRYLLASDELLRLGLLVETDSGYRFSHDQVRQAAYNRLSPSQRERLHQRVAQAIESLFPERFEALAHHFAAGGKREPAIHYSIRAASRAREQFAYQSALSCYDRLLNLLTRPDDRAARYDVLCDRAEVLDWIGDREAQGRDLEEMLSLARDLGDEGRVADALYRRSEYQRIQGRYGLADQDALAALDIYRRLGDGRAQADLLSQLGWNALYTTDYPQASGYLEEALRIYRSLSDIPGQVHCLIGLASAASLRGDYFLAFSYGQECLDLTKATNDPHQIGRALFNAGLTHFDLGDIEAAEDLLRQALRLSQVTNDRRRQAAAHFYLGVVPAERDGDLAAARSHLDIALTLFREVEDLSWEGDCLAALGRLALLQGDPTTAIEHLKAAYRRRRELGEPAYAVIDLSYIALAELALGDGKSAWRHSREAVAELEAGLSGVEYPHRIYYNHYRVAEAVSHWAAARAALEKAASIMEEGAAKITAPALQETYRTGTRINRAIASALAQLPPPGRLRVRLARADIPAHRRPDVTELVSLVWTVDAGERDAAIAEREGKVALRRRRILRLLDEAKAVGAMPTVADLAGALGVSSRTVRADLTALRQQGHAVRTRGRCA